MTGPRAEWGSAGPGTSRFGRRPEEEVEPVVIRDRRRLDPQTGEPRTADGPLGADSGEPGPAGPGQEAPAVGGPSSGGPGAAGGAQIAELTADLQRVKAEFDNYRRRVDRDRALVAEQATGALLGALLPVLDDVDRARAHGDLTGAFGAVGEALVTLTARLGLERFGAPGEPFDPTVHEALLHAESADVQEATAVEVLRPGYRYAGRVLRPAQVAVAAPATSPAEAPAGPGDYPGRVDLAAGTDEPGVVPGEE